jgi:hypothetical protein
MRVVTISALSLLAIPFVSCAETWTHVYRPDTAQFSTRSGDLNCVQYAGKPTVPMSDHTRAVKAVVGSLRPAFTQCYQDYLSTVGSSAGTCCMYITVRQNGTVAQVDASSFLPTSLLGCLMARAGDAQFPTDRRQGETVAVPITFVAKPRRQTFRPQPCQRPRSEDSAPHCSDLQGELTPR